MGTTMGTLVQSVLNIFTPLEIMPRSVSSRNDWNF